MRRGEHAVMAKVSIIILFTTFFRRICQFFGSPGIIYLAKHPQEKIVFFIDEVSESIAQKKINLLDLEGLSESLSALGNRVWTVGIAQQAFNDVLNAAGLNLHLLDKVEARFKTRIPIAAEEIDKIIRKQLLDKTDAGKQELQQYYDKNSGMILAVTNISGLALDSGSSGQSCLSLDSYIKPQPIAVNWLIISF